MSKALQEQVQILYDSVKDLNSIEEIRPHCEKFNEWINTHTNYSVESLGTVLSQASFYKLFKSLPLEQGKNSVLVEKFDRLDKTKVVGHELKHYVLSVCGLSKKDWDDRNQTSRVSDRLNNINEDGSNGIEIDPDTYLEITGKLLESENPHEVAVGLIAATGRRPHEILARGKFTAIKGEDYKVSFEGQGKKRGEKPVFTIGTLYPARHIIDRLNWLRKDESIAELLKEVEQEFSDDLAAQNRAIESRRGNSLRRVVQNSFGGNDDKTPLLNFRQDKEQNDCKALRAACACLVAKRDFKGSMGSEMLFVAKFLGHITSDENPSDNDLKHIITTIGYSDYFTNKEVEFTVINKQRELGNVKVYKDELVKFNGLQKSLNCKSQADLTSKLINSGNHIQSLQSQLINAQETIKNLQQELKIMSEVTLNPQTVNDSDDLKERVAKLEDLVSQLLEGKQIKSSNLASVKPEKPEKEDHIDWESVPSEVLKGEISEEDKEKYSHIKVKSQGAIAEKIKRAFQAITNFNDKATSNDERWYVGNGSLRDLTRCNGQVVTKWIKEHQLLVDDHNNKYNLEQYHNHRHKNINLNDLVSW